MKFSPMLSLMPQPIFTCSWNVFDRLIQRLLPRILAHGCPDLVVGLQRGGLIPAVMLAHRLDIPLLRTLPVRSTTSDTVYAEKQKPVIEVPEQLSILAGRDVLVVDDVAGSGATIRAVAQLLQQYHPARIRTLVVVLNLAHWQQANTEDPARLFSYIGQPVWGWVIFPWEKQPIKAPDGALHCLFLIEGER